MFLMEKVMDFIENPSQKLSELMPKLLDLQQRLQAAKFLAAPEETTWGNTPIRGLILFLNSVSSWCNRRELVEITCKFQRSNYHGQYNKIIHLLCELDNHFAETDVLNRSNIRVDQVAKEILANHIDPMCNLIDQLGKITS